MLAVSGLACPRIWYVTVVSVDESLRPEFCISTRKECRGGPVDLGNFFVLKIEHTELEGERFTDYVTVWGIQARANVPLGRLVYGDVPEGWSQVQAPEPLALNQPYSVGPACFTLVRREQITWTMEPGAGCGGS
jgi:hypothetical protein